MQITLRGLRVRIAGFKVWLYHKWVIPFRQVTYCLLIWKNEGIWLDGSNKVFIKRLASILGFTGCMASATTTQLSSWILKQARLCSSKTWFTKRDSKPDLLASGLEYLWDSCRICVLWYCFIVKPHVWKGLLLSCFLCYVSQELTRKQKPPSYFNRKFDI